MSAAVRLAIGKLRIVERGFLIEHQNVLRFFQRGPVCVEKSCPALLIPYPFITEHGQVGGPSDEKEFSNEAVRILRTAGQDLYYLLNQGYPIKGASVFVGNHYLLSERQRLALARAVSPIKNIECRQNKELHCIPENSTIHIDGFNTIITLEVAFSDSLLLKCMDGTIRDLAALRGTYRLIDKTDSAILRIGQALEKSKIKKAVFYLDAPVSNSGRLKVRIMELLASFPFEIQIENINNVDMVLKTLDHVVTSDAIILDNCKSWINLTGQIIEEAFNGYPFIDLDISSVQ